MIDNIFSHHTSLKLISGGFIQILENFTLNSAINHQNIYFSKLRLYNIRTLIIFLLDTHQMQIFIINPFESVEIKDKLVLEIDVSSQVLKSKLGSPHSERAEEALCYDEPWIDLCLSQKNMVDGIAIYYSNGISCYIDDIDVFKIPTEQISDFFEIRGYKRKEIKPLLEIEGKTFEYEELGISIYVEYDWEREDDNAMEATHLKERCSHLVAYGRNGCDRLHW
jgi:hypothetical protein